MKMKCYKLFSIFCLPGLCLVSFLNYFKTLSYVNFLRDLVSLCPVLVSTPLTSPEPGAPKLLRTPLYSHFPLLKPLFLSKTTDWVLLSQDTTKHFVCTKVSGVCFKPGTKMLDKTSGYTEEIPELAEGFSGWNLLRSSFSMCCLSKSTWEAWALGVSGLLMYACQAEMGPWWYSIPTSPPRSTWYPGRCWNGLLTSSISIMCSTCRMCVSMSCVKWWTPSWCVSPTSKPMESFGYLIPVQITVSTYMLANTCSRTMTNSTHAGQPLLGAKDHSHVLVPGTQAPRKSHLLPGASWLQWRARAA